MPEEGVQGIKWWKRKNDGPSNIDSKSRDFRRLPSRVGRSKDGACQVNNTVRVVLDGNYTVLWLLGT